MPWGLTNQFETPCKNTWGLLIRFWISSCSIHISTVTGFHCLYDGGMPDPELWDVFTCLSCLILILQKQQKNPKKQKKPSTSKFYSSKRLPRLRLLWGSVWTNLILPCFQLVPLTEMLPNSLSHTKNTKIAVRIRLCWFTNHHVQKSPGVLFLIFFFSWEESVSNHVCLS